VEEAPDAIANTIAPSFWSSSSLGRPGAVRRRHVRILRWSDRSQHRAAIIGHTWIDAEVERRHGALEPYIREHTHPRERSGPPQPDERAGKNASENDHNERRHEDVRGGSRPVYTDHAPSNPERVTDASGGVRKGRRHERHDEVEGKRNSEEEPHEQRDVLRCHAHDDERDEDDRGEKTQNEVTTPKRPEEAERFPTDMRIPR
jgi:hypothetical protein